MPIDFSSFSEYVSWEKRHFYSQTFPLSEKYPLVGFDSLVATQIVYGLIVLWGYVRMNGDKKPLFVDGRAVLRVYNLLQVVLSGYIAYLATSTYLNKVIYKGQSAT